MNWLVRWADFNSAWGKTGIKCAINMLVHILGSHAARAHKEKNVNGIRCVSQWLHCYDLPRRRLNTVCLCAPPLLLISDQSNSSHLSLCLVCLSLLVSSHVFYVHIFLSASLLWYPPFSSLSTSPFLSPLHLLSSLKSSHVFISFFFSFCFFSSSPSLE